MHTPLLSLNHVGVAYRRRVGLFKREPFWALRDVNFDLFNGETLGIIGRNGVGKSTVLQIIAGMIEPDVGVIKRFQPAIASLLTLQVGFINHLSGRDNAILSGLMMGLSKQRIVECIDNIIDFSELGNAIDQPVYTYSSGMRARLGFSVAILAEPDILLIDETLGVGDIRFKEKSTAAIKQRIQSDQTVVLVSHNGGLIRELCNRVAWIENGVSKAQGDSNLVLDEYNQFVNSKSSR